VICERKGCQEAGERIAIAGLFLACLCCPCARALVQSMSSSREARELVEAEVKRSSWWTKRAAGKARVLHTIEACKNEWRKAAERWLARGIR